MNYYLYFLEDFYFRGLTALKHLKFEIDDIEPTDILLEDQQNLISLDLSYNGLKSLPDKTLKNKPDLKVLSLAHNNFENISNNMFSSLENLESLDLSHNALHFTLELGFQNLRTLNLSHNRILTISETVFLPNLTTVEILDIKEMYGEDTFKKQINLRKFCRGQTGLNAFCEIKDYSLLYVEGLIVSVNNVNVPTILSKYIGTKDLKSIDFKCKYLSETNLQTLIALFEKNTSLRHLSLDAGLVTSTILFHNLQFLETIVIKKIETTILSSYNQVNLFSKCTKLLRITINLSELIELDKNTFHNQHLLEELDLSINKIRFLPKTIFMNLKSLKTLNLAFNQIGFLSDTIFMNLSNLTTLDLSFNEINWLTESMFAKLKSLLVLKLDGNKLPVSFNV